MSKNILLSVEFTTRLKKGRYKWFVVPHTKVNLFRLSHKHLSMLNFSHFFFLGGGQQGFLYWEEWGRPSPISQKFTHPFQNSFTPLTKGSFPHTNKQFSRYNSIKSSFLAVVIAPLPFLFYLHTTGYGNFDFNQCSIFTECCF